MHINGCLIKSSQWSFFFWSQKRHYFFMIKKSWIKIASMMIRMYENQMLRFFFLMMFQLLTESQRLIINLFWLGVIKLSHFKNSWDNRILFFPFFFFIIIFVVKQDDQLFSIQKRMKLIKCRFSKFLKRKSSPLSNPTNERVFEEIIFVIDKLIMMIHPNGG